MAAVSPSIDAADTQKRRRGRPPLLATSPLNSGRRLDHLLKQGSSSSASTSTSSASVVAGYELFSAENLDPNVNPCRDLTSALPHICSATVKCSLKSDDLVSEPKQVSGDHSRNAISTEDPNAVPANVSRSPDPKRKSNAAGISNPLPDRNIENRPGASGQTQIPKKPGPGRPRMQEVAISEAVTLNDTSSSLTKETPNALQTKKKSNKRKHDILSGPLDTDDRNSLIRDFSLELASLIRFFHEDEKVDLSTSGFTNVSRRVEIALLLEESSLPFSSLISNILLQLQVADDGTGGSDLTPASVRSIVLSIGERISFGTPNPDADVLEDDSDASLWSWEVRDIKLIPEEFRNSISDRRRKRRKISERIGALSGIIAALKATIDQDRDSYLLEKAKDLLQKTENEEQIRSHVGVWQQKTALKGAVQAEKRKEKDALKEKQRIARETEREQRRLEKEEEKEKKRMEKEEERKKIQQEKERERLSKERERLEREASKQRSKEALRQEKEFKKQQEEAEKEQRRKEKEEADMKRRSEIKKQANIMGRFLQSKRDQAEFAAYLPDQPGVVYEVSDASPLQQVICCMDIEILNGDEKSTHDLLSSHLVIWKKHSSASRCSMRRWAQRRMPKMSAGSELRLQGQSYASDGPMEAQSGHEATTSGVSTKRLRSDCEENEQQKLQPEWDDSGLMDLSVLLEQGLVSDPPKSFHFQNKRRKLLQFDKSYRPAYYGSFSKKSYVVRPRNPLRLDPNLDYENDSDEEWEEEDPGESLSDCDKDEEEEKLDPDEDEEGGDGFLVPDGYLSESEGAHVEESESESDIEHLPDEFSREIDTSSRPKESYLLVKFARQRKALEQLTDHALRCNRPYIICNFHQGKSPMQNTDRLCLEALRVCSLANGVQIEVPEDPRLGKFNDDTKKSIKQRAKKALPETYLQEMVEILLSSTFGLKKLANLLSTKFPTAPRSLLKDKVKEIADFVDNRWQVKKEVLEQLGITSVPPVATHPEPVSKSPQLKPITKFFSKRCLPPETAGLSDSSPTKCNEDCRKNMAIGEIFQDNIRSTPAQTSSIRAL